jgi:hypothetical protein
LGNRACSATAEDATFERALSTVIGTKTAGAASASTAR